MSDIPLLKGFRDFYPRDCAQRNYLFDTIREVAHRYGFAEWEGPIVESADLYRKKSGDEILGQLFHFTDKGDREVALRPELTPTLARMATKRARDFKKPMKWFEIGRCFRYEAPQRGRTREFYQFNCDILGEASPEADAELITLVIDLMLALGFTDKDFTVRLSDRKLWDGFMEKEGIAADQRSSFLGTIDKWEKMPEAKMTPILESLGSSYAKVSAFMDDPAAATEALGELRTSLEARGVWEYITVDPSIVRGLAYYTGAVFELADKKRGMRAIAGGGRYDELCGLIGGEKNAMPACGFAMGDVVIADLIAETAEARDQAEEAIAAELGMDIYVVVASEAQRAAACGIAQDLRAGGIRVELPLSATKVGKQFAAAEDAGAVIAVVVGDEFPMVKVKDLATREEVECAYEDIGSAVSEALFEALEADGEPNDTDEAEA